MQRVNALKNTSTALVKIDLMEFQTLEKGLIFQNAPGPPKS